MSVSPPGQYVLPLHTSQGELGLSWQRHLPCQPALAAAGQDPGPHVVLIQLRRHNEQAQLEELARKCLPAWGRLEDDLGPVACGGPIPPLLQSVGGFLAAMELVRGHLLGP